MKAKIKVDISNAYSSTKRALAVLAIGSTAALYPLAVQAQAIDVGDLYYEDDYTSFSLSPSGNLLAFGDNRSSDKTIIQIYDLRKDAVIHQIPVQNDSLLWVDWATEDRLLISIVIEKDMRLPSRYRIKDEDGNRSQFIKGIKYARMMAVNVDGSDPVFMMKDLKKDLKRNFRLDRVTSVLSSDPDHILIPAIDNGTNLYKVNIHTGEYEKVQDGKEKTYAFDVDRNGFAYARYDRSYNGKYVKVYVRAEGEKKWTKLTSVREEDLENFSPVSHTEVPGQIYVSGSPDGEDRAAIYRYDLVNKKYLEKIAEHPRVDVNSVLTDFDGNYVGTAFTEHRLTYDFEDVEMNKHMAALNAALSDKMNVKLMEVSRKDGYWLVLTSGPQDPGTINIYDPKQTTLDSFIQLNSKIDYQNLSPMSVVNYTASDGQALTGYLTTPRHYKKASPAPLVVLVHGGPEARDYYDFEHWSQYLASNGFSVFQPQFRGSSGFGTAFSEAGYGEWGGRMQDDVTDGVEHLIKTGQADRDRICIIGASYGGYAALMGAVKTPELYQCASSINGVTDLLEQADYDKDMFGKDSEAWDYVRKQMGDPKKDKDRMMANSPTRQAKHIQIPIQLIHGSDDEIVPIEQSEMMRDALEDVQNPAEYIRLENVDHSLNGRSNTLYGRRNMLENLRKFLWTHLQSDQTVQTQMTVENEGDPVDIIVSDTPSP